MSEELIEFDVFLNFPGDPDPISSTKHSKDLLLFIVIVLVIYCRSERLTLIRGQTVM